MTIAIVKNALRSVLMLTLAAPALAQRHDPPASLPAGVTRTDLKDSPGPGASASPLLGKWSYRSFRNEAIAHRLDGKRTLDELGILCEAGELTIEAVDGWSLRGTLTFNSNSKLELRGSVTLGSPPSLRFQGKGITGDHRDAVHDFEGFYVLDWPGGNGQIPAIVGSVVDRSPGSGASSKPGYVASFIAVRAVESSQTPSSPAGMLHGAQRTQAGPARPAERQAMERLRKSWQQFLERRATGAGHPSALAATDVRQPQPTPPAPQRLEMALSAQTPFAPADVIHSQAGVLRTTLTVQYAQNQIGGDQVRLRAYNGKLVGPTLRAKPGDTLRITLSNRLPVEPDASAAHELFHGWNTTNLHTHGLHVSPAGNSDNVLLELGPGQDFEAEIKIPEDHPPGTFWYHAHKHGSVAAQVSSGMSGALIIEGGLDEVPEIKAAQEKVFVFQQVPYIIDQQEHVGVVELQYVDQIFGPGTWDALGRHTTINGQVVPVLEMRPGEVQRWRFIHSGVRESILVRVMKAAADGSLTQATSLNEIAVDGLALGKMVVRDVVELQPGYRSDVLIKTPSAQGDYLLVDDRSPADQSLLSTEEPRKYLARIRVSGDLMDMPLPGASSLQPLKPLPSVADGELTGTQTATYNIQTSPTLRFLIDGREFDPSFSRKLKLGAVEEWTVRGFVANHPFHIHVNPFEVISIKDSNGVEKLSEPVWKDTILMPNGGTVKFRTRYQRYIGSFVQHCHILDHEDQGMMELVEIGL